MSPNCLRNTDSTKKKSVSLWKFKFKYLAKGFSKMNRDYLLFLRKKKNKPNSICCQRQNSSFPVKIRIFGKLISCPLVTFPILKRLLARLRFLKILHNKNVSTIENKHSSVSSHFQMIYTNVIKL